MKLPFNNRNSWELAGRRAQQYRRQALDKPVLTQEERQQKQQELDMLTKQIRSMRGHFGTEAYARSQDLLDRAQALDNELN